MLEGRAQNTRVSGDNITGYQHRTNWTTLGPMGFFPGGRRDFIPAYKEKAAAILCWHESIANEEDGAIRGGIEKREKQRVEIEVKRNEREKELLAWEVTREGAMLTWSD